MNPLKCVFSVTSKILLGVIIHHYGIKINLNMVKEILEMWPPRLIRKEGKKGVLYYLSHHLTPNKVCYPPMEKHYQALYFASLKL